MSEKRSKSEIAKRYALFILSLFFSGLGVAFTKHGELGVSPISSVPNILSYKYTFFTMGTWLIAWNFLMIFAQIIILKKKFKPVDFLQFPLAFLFGYFTDFGLWLVASVPIDFYPIRLFMVVLGVLTLGFGIALAVIADVIMNSGEALVRTIADTWHKDFANVKIIFDVCNVSLSIILSLIFFNFTIVGAREGTLIAAFGTGIAVKLFRKLLHKPISRTLTK